MDEYEQILLVKQEVFVYRIPPRTTARGVRAADWKLDAPDWTGRMRLVAKGKECILKLEDKISGELFAQCPIDKYPGVAVEAVTDSSRYFVVRLEGEGRTAFIGMGFADRGDSFDLNLSLQDHFKWLQKTEEIEDQKAKPDDQPHLDLGFKDGQTITINMNIAKKSSSGKPRTKPSAPGGGGIGLLPPPPGSAKVPGPPSAKNSPPAPSPADPPLSGSSAELLLDLMGGEAVPAPAATTANIPSTHSNEIWGDFAAAAENSDPTKEAAAAANWVQF